MAEALLINLFDLKLNFENGGIEKSLLRVLKFADKYYGARKPCVYIMCCRTQQCERPGGQKCTLFPKATENLQVLNNGFEFVWNSSMAAMLYYIKQRLDDEDVSIVKMILPQSATPSMEVFVNYLFTDVYHFEFTFLEEIEQEHDFRMLSDIRCAVHNNKQVQHVKSDIETFLRSVPGTKGDITILKSPLISDSVFIHGFSTRAGGISLIETLSSLNLFSSSKRKDPKAVVAENLHRLAKAAGFNPKTYHSVKVDHANVIWVMGKTEPESYDGIVTNRKAATIVAPGADCIPLLFADPVKKVCGAAHSGWKGTLMGVAMATVNAMVAEYGCCVEDIAVVLGPSVGPCCFTLPRGDAEAFHDIDPTCVWLYDLPRPFIDIRRATRILLERGGVLPQNIQDDSVADASQNLTLCTSCHPDMFFSHVRDGINFGTQIGFISIKD